MSELVFFVSGEPVAKARPRVAIRRTRDGRAFGQAYTPSKTRDWEDQIKSHCLAACQASSWLPDPHTVSVSLRFNLVHRVGNRRRGDIDNYAKSVLDGLNGVAFPDDQLIDRLDVLLVHNPDDPGVWVQVQRNG